MKRGKSEGFDCCDRPSNLTQIGFKSALFQSVWSWNFIDDTEKQWGMYSLLCESLCVISNPLVNYSYSPETLNSGQIWQFFVRVTLKFNGWPWKTGVKVRKRSIRVKTGDYLSPVTWKSDGWPWEIIGHLFYTTSSFVHRLKDMGEFKLELQSGNAQFGSKSGFLVPCDLEIWQMTLKNNMSPLLYHVKLCASVKNNGWIRTGFTVRSAQFRSKWRFYSRVTLKFDGWSW